MLTPLLCYWPQFLMLCFFCVTIFCNVVVMSVENRVDFRVAALARSIIAAAFQFVLYCGSFYVGLF